MSGSFENCHKKGTPPPAKRQTYIRFFLVETGRIGHCGTWNRAHASSSKATRSTGAGTAGLKRPGQKQKQPCHSLGFLD